MRQLVCRHGLSNPHHHCPEDYSIPINCAVVWVLPAWWCCMYESGGNALTADKTIGFHVIATDQRTQEEGGWDPAKGARPAICLFWYSTEEGAKRYKNRLVADGAISA